MTSINSTEALIEDIRLGRMVILMDDEDRENEGDLVMAASMVRPEDINFMARHARGLICLTLTADRCKQLKLPLMVDESRSSHGTNFTLSIEAASGVTTGISAADRAHTIRTAVAAHAHPEDIVQPGHVFPLMARRGGVLHRAGHTEAGCDLTRLAGLIPAAVIVEIMNEDGTMARRPELEQFAKQFDLKLGTIADLIQYRVRHDKTVVRLESHSIQTEFGAFELVMFQDLTSDEIHCALVHGDPTAEQVPLVRVHIADVLRDLIGLKIEGRSGWSLHRSLKTIADSGCGVVVLLGYAPTTDQLQNRIKSVLTDRSSFPTIEKEKKVRLPEYRTIGAGSQILRELGVHRMRLLSSQIKFSGLSGFDLEIVEFVVCED